jgi:acyl-CoA synthetase (NDP forming)
MANSELARISKRSCLNLAVQLMAPVALKIVSSDILHKTEIGAALRLNLNNPNDIENAFNDIIEAGTKHYPKCRISTV